MENEQKIIEIGTSITVHDLAEKLGVSVSSLITDLIKNGVMATINDHLDYDTAAIVAADFGFEVSELASDQNIEPAMKKKSSSKRGVDRPPVVAIMGHVDHGKTSLLDAIRGTEVTKGEAGGITQHISAYHVKHKKRSLTFLDTPGHEAFSSLRAHGAALTDVAVIVVAADDGVKPQTKEAVEFAKKAGVQIVVAVNKIDKPGADINRVKQQLSDIGLIAEDWGGETVVVEVSAKTKLGIEQLLDIILLVADINELKADLDVPAEGIVIESHLAVGKGPVATLLIEQGVLEINQLVIAGGTYAKIRSMQDEDGQNVQSASPSRAVSVSGFKAVPQFGDRFQVVASEKEARRVSLDAGMKHEEKRLHNVKSIVNAEDLLANMAQQGYRSLNLVLKADVRGSLESITQSLETLGNDEVGVKVISSGIGNVTDSDVALAKNTGSIVIGFQIVASPTIKRVAAREGVEVKIYSVIYELLDDIKHWLEEMLSPEIVEIELGRLKIKGVFRTTRDHIICGGEVTKGKIELPAIAKLYHGEEKIGEAEVLSLQKAQQATKEVVSGEMCGLELKTTKKIQVLEEDIIEFVRREERKRTLAS